MSLTNRSPLSRQNAPTRSTAASQSGVQGAAMAFFLYIAAACEIAVAMAIVVMLVERRGSLDLAGDYELKG